MARAGFLGLGVMGLPMALNIARKFPLTVWNRSVSKYPPLVQAGAETAKTASEVLERSDITFVMLYDENAIRTLLNDNFRLAIRNKTLVNCSSVSVAFSQYLSEQIRDAGGHFVEMPVSGSKVPAEQGQLVGMMAGDRAAADHIRPFVEPITRAAVYCGPIGSGLKTKYAVNAYLIALTAGLAEAMNLARAQGLDLEAVGQVLDAGPMASAYSKIKVGKILSGDWTTQASIKDCYNSTQLIQTAARESNAWSPLVDVCATLYRQANENGMSEEDMIAVMKVIAESAENHRGSESVPTESSQ